MEFREVFKVNNRFEADVIEEALQEEEIPYRLQTSEETTLESVFHLQHGFGIFLVPEEELARAKEVIDAVLKARAMDMDESEIDHTGGEA